VFGHPGDGTWRGRIWIVLVVADVARVGENAGQGLAPWRKLADRPPVPGARMASVPPARPVVVRLLLDEGFESCADGWEQVVERWR
jgi:hypothetical protein